MKPHDQKNTKPPTRFVGGSGHWNWRGDNTKPKEKK